MNPELPSYLTPGSQNPKGHSQRRVDRRSPWLAILIVFVVAVTLAAILLPVVKKTPGVTFTADLAGGNESATLSTPAKGTVSLTVALDGSSVTYLIQVDNITDPSAARLHVGGAGSTGAAILTLFSGPVIPGPFTGTLAHGNRTALALEGPLQGKTLKDLLALIKAGSVYLVVGTSVHPSGEIRGQLK
jgi:hypothetical protein